MALWKSRKEVRRSIASLPAKCRQLAKVLPSSDGTVTTDLDREFEGIEKIAWRRRVVLPTNPWRSAWDWILIVLVIYSSLSVPMEICFRYDPPLAVQVIDWFVDIFFIFDLLLNFRTAYQNYDGTFEIEPFMIRNHYLMNWFLIDLVASIPIERIFGGGSGSEAIALAKMPRLLRLSRLLKKLDKFTSARFMRVISVLIFFLMFTHFVGCFWWLIGVSQGEHGWQFREEVVPIILQDISWEGEERLQTPPISGDDGNTPDWLRELYNHSALLEVYEQEVGVGKAYITSLYWALTMVMKSPWLPPQSTGEQAFASMIVVFGAIVFAAFLGHVTTMIQSYEKSNALYRDQMTSMHNFFEARVIERPTQKSLLTYTDAYFKARVEGVPERNIIASLPAHMRPPVLMELYNPLLESCTFLQECSYSGCGDFLERLDPEVCLKGDCLLRAGTCSEFMYIMMRGELQVSYPPEGSQVRRITNLLGSSRLIAQQEADHKQSTRIPQGRIERRGSLIGWQAPFGRMTPFRYTARAYRFSQLFSIKRPAMREVLELHPIDAAVWLKAVEHANKLLQPSKSSRSTFDLSKRADGGADDAVRRVSEAMDSNAKSSGDDHAKSAAMLGAAARGGFLPDQYLEPGAGGIASPLSPSSGTKPPQQRGVLDDDDDDDFNAAAAPSAGNASSAAQITAARPSSAWMAAREQAEAALRADMQAIRNELHSGFQQLNAALAEMRASHPPAAAGM